MAAYLRPRRGSAAGATTVLQEGELFLDISKLNQSISLPSWGRIFIGDGNTELKNLKPFIDYPQNMVITEGISSTGTIDDIGNGKSLSTMFSAIKNLASAGEPITTKTYGDLYGEFIATKVGRICFLYVPSMRVVLRRNGSGWAAYYEVSTNVGTITDSDYSPLTKDAYFILGNDSGSGVLSLTINDSNSIYVSGKIQRDSTSSSYINLRTAPRIVSYITAE